MRQNRGKNFSHFLMNCVFNSSSFMCKRSLWNSAGTGTNTERRARNTKDISPLGCCDHRLSGRYVFPAALCSQSSPSSTGQELVHGIPLTAFTLCFPSQHPFLSVPPSLNHVTLVFERGGVFWLPGVLLRTASGVRLGDTHLPNWRCGWWKTYDD